MDVYDGKGIGVGAQGHDAGTTTWIDLRKQMGYTLDYARRIDLLAMVPRDDLASTKYCLANVAQSESEYLVYLPQGGSATVDLTGSSGKISVEWFSTRTARFVPAASVEGGDLRKFTAPFKGQAILYLFQREF
jgi:hypothetical protein